MQRCTNASVSDSAPAKVRTQIWIQQLMLCCTERSNHTGVIVSNIKNIIWQFFVFWKLHSKSTWLRNLRGHMPPHFEWAWRLWSLNDASLSTKMCLKSLIWGIEVRVTLFRVDSSWACKASISRFKADFSWSAVFTSPLCFTPNASRWRI